METPTLTDLERYTREFQDLLAELGDANKKVEEADEALKEKRALYDHYRQEYEVAVLKRNEIAAPLVEVRSRIQDVQMRSIDALLRFIAEGQIIAEGQDD